MRTNEPGSLCLMYTTDEHRGVAYIRKGPPGRMGRQATLL